MLEHLKGQYVKLSLWDRESPEYETIGGGISEGDPLNIIILLDVDAHWVEFQWEHTGQVVGVPVTDVVCIASDLPGKGQEEAEVPSGSVGYNLFADMLERVDSR